MYESTTPPEAPYNNLFLNPYSVKTYVFWCPRRYSVNCIILQPAVRRRCFVSPEDPAYQYDRRTFDGRFLRLTKTGVSSNVANQLLTYTLPIGCIDLNPVYGVSAETPPQVRKRADSQWCRWCGPLNRFCFKTPMCRSLAVQTVVNSVMKFGSVH